ncbi:unnamed protein product, partial [Ectocarpus fasciculatus]
EDTTGIGGHVKHRYNSPGVAPASPAAVFLSSFLALAITVTAKEYTAMDAGLRAQVMRADSRWVVDVRAGALCGSPQLLDDRLSVPAGRPSPNVIPQVLGIRRPDTLHIEATRTII